MVPKLSYHGYIFMYFYVCFRLRYGSKIGELSGRRYFWRHLVVEINSRPIIVKVDEPTTWN